jgi:putative PIN family toxin of toxin-antitoxin system
VSGLISKQGHPRKLIDLWLSNSFDLITSRYLIDELRHVLNYPHLRRLLKFNENEIKYMLSEINRRAILVPGDLDLKGLTRDPKDDAVVACAVEGQVDFIVSGDKDILELNQYQGIKMINPTDFIAHMDRQ